LWSDGREASSSTVAFFKDCIGKLAVVAVLLDMGSATSFTSPRRFDQAPLSGCVGRAFITSSLPRAAISPAVILTGVFRTNQRTSWLHGGVVSDPSKTMRPY